MRRPTIPTCVFRINRSPSRLTVWCSAVAMAVGHMVLAGCGSPKTIVSGVVTLDGAPLKKACIDFIPADGKSKVCTVVCDDAGRYQAVVSAVTYKVVVVAQHVVGTMVTELGGTADIYEFLTPPVYRNREETPLSVSPAEGKRTVANFEIPSKP